MTLTTTKHTGCFEGALKVVLGFFANNVYLDKLGIVNVFESHERLNEEGLGIVEIEVHYTHHPDTHVSSPQLSRHNYRRQDNDTNESLQVLRFLGGRSPGRSL